VKARLTTSGDAHEDTFTAMEHLAATYFARKQCSKEETLKEKIIEAR
jgi:hypothetical protein